MIRKIYKKIYAYTHIDYLIENSIRQNATATRIELLNYLALNSKDSGISNEKYCNEDIIISLTTYGKRLDQIYLTIESLLQQSVKPNKICLWIDRTYKKKPLSKLLKKQIDRGLEIFYCEDIRSYTKLIPALEMFPTSTIITVDDDLFYNINMVENLVSAYIEDPQYIYFNRGHRLKLLETKKIAPYKKWEWNISDLTLSPLNFPTGVGGVLYPPTSFNKEVFNETKFMNLCPFADDVWFKAMALFNNTQSKKVSTFSKNGEEYLSNSSVQDTALHLQNISQNKNDIQVKNVFEEYDLYDKLKKCR